MIGQTVILHGTRTASHKLVDAAPQGAILNIRPATRSNEQNAKMHAMISDVARAKPGGREHPPHVWKALLMSLAGFKPLFEPGLDGQGVVPIGYKSSRLTRAEFSDLIECIYAFGAEHSVEWSEPPLTNEAKDAA